MIFGLVFFIAFGVWIGQPWWLWVIEVAAIIEGALEQAIFD